MKIKVGPEVDAQIAALGAGFLPARRSGALDEAERILLGTWALIPEPKLEHDYYPQSLSRTLVEFYRDTKQHDKAKQWLTTLGAAYDVEDLADDPSCAMLAGTVYYEAGEHERAFLYFRKLYTDFKRRPFKSSDPRYLEFTLDRVGKR